MTALRHCLGGVVLSHKTKNRDNLLWESLCLNIEEFATKRNLDSSSSLCCGWTGGGNSGADGQSRCHLHQTAWRANHDRRLASRPTRVRHRLCGSLRAGDKNKNMNILYKKYIHIVIPIFSSTSHYIWIWLSAFWDRGLSQSVHVRWRNVEGKWEEIFCHPKLEEWLEGEAMSTPLCSIVEMGQERVVACTHERTIAHFWSTNTLKVWKQSWFVHCEEVSWWSIVVERHVKFDVITANTFTCLHVFPQLSKLL